MKKLNLLFFVVFFLFACTNRHNNNDNVFEVQKSIELNSIEYPDILGISMQLLKKDSLLLINDFRGDSLIHVFDLKKMQLVRKIISVGNGPNELISPLEIHFTDNNLYIFYRQASILYSIPNTNILEGSKNMKELFRISSDANHLYPLSDSIFIASGFYQKRYAIINNKGEIIKKFGEYPSYWSEEHDIPDKARAMFHQTNFLKHPNGQRFLTYSSHIIEIYNEDLINANPVLIKKILIGKYQYDYIITNILSANKKPDTERGIVYVACSHKYIYVVYDPSKNTNESENSQIFVYDWNVHPIEKLLFNKKISCLFIDENGGKGYVIAEDPNDSLMYFYLV